MQGWIKLHREVMEKAIWSEATPEQKTILITLLMMANHKEKEWEWQGKKYKAKPGQFVTSLDSIIKNCGVGISVQNVRTALKRFETYGFLTNQSTNKNRLITIVNWGFYQGIEEQLTSNLTSSQQATNKQLTTNKNDKECKNEKKNKYADFVSLTLEEYEKLKSQFGENGAAERIQQLNLYKGSTGKKYKNDYLTILNWERKKQPQKPKDIDWEAL